MFPIIKHISDISPFIKDKEEFAYFERDGYTIIDYNFSDSSTFGAEGSVFRELRGIMFDKEGNLISRPFHKFFNYGEKPDEDRIDWAGCYYQEKMDGSMVRPVRLKGKWTFCTRKGVTDVSKQAQEWLEAHPQKLLFEAFFSAYEGYTLLFEWCSRKSRIVIDHPVDRLVLLAVRHNRTGKYIPPAGLDRIKELCYNDIAPITYFSLAQTSKEFLDTVKQFKDSEGVVVTTLFGKKVKIKADAYCLMHKSTSRKRYY